MKNFTRLFVTYGVIAIVMWVAYFLVHIVLGEALFAKSTIANLWWNFHSNNPIMWVIDFFAIVYLVHFIIKNE